MPQFIHVDLRGVKVRLLGITVWKVKLQRGDTFQWGRAMRSEGGADRDAKPGTGDVEFGSGIAQQSIRQNTLCHFGTGFREIFFYI